MNNDDDVIPREPTPSLDVIMIPGMWLDGASWDAVTPVLDSAGHRTHPLTLPGLGSRHADRSAITLRDHVDAVIAVIDSIEQSLGPVVLVGHSRGGAIVHAAADARPDRVARVIYVDCWPTGPGGGGADGYPAVNGEIPLPEWSLFDDEDLVDLNDDLRAAFRARAVPTPEHVAKDIQELFDDRRYDIPATVIACEFTSAMLREWMAGGEPQLQELAKLRDVEYIDLPTGHWPQFTRPTELGRAILAAIGPST